VQLTMIVHTRNSVHFLAVWPVFRLKFVCVLYVNYPKEYAGNTFIVEESASRVKHKKCGSLTILIL
jgi:hypothetical protein